MRFQHVRKDGGRPLRSRVLSDMLSVYVGFLLGTLVIFLLVLALVGYLLIQGLLTVPLVRTRPRMSKRMLELAGFQPGQKVLDLGSGDGSIVFEAVRMGGNEIGMERLRILVWFARLRAKLKRCRAKAMFIHGDLLVDPLPSASIVTCYLFTEVNKQLEPRLQEYLPSGTKVVSRDFTFPRLRKIGSESFGGSVLHVYEV